MSKLAKVTIGCSLIIVCTIGALSSFGASSEGKLTPQARSAASSTENSEISAPAEESQEMSPVVAAALKASPKAQQIAGCKIALALMNDRDVSTFSGESAGLNTVHVKWRSPDDGKLWEARCEKTGEGRLQWAAYNAFGDGEQGRWRTEDSIRMVVEGDRITVTVKQPGWPEKRDSRLLDELT